mgnify:CR=1 FL=1
MASIAFQFSAKRLASNIITRRSSTKLSAVYASNVNLFQNNALFSSTQHKQHASTLLTKSNILNQNTKSLYNNNTNYNMRPYNSYCYNFQTLTNIQQRDACLEINPALSDSISISHQTLSFPKGALIKICDLHRKNPAHRDIEALN